MKTCFKCGETKKLYEFYPHKQMKDGHLNKCKSCTKKDSESRRKRLERTDLDWVLKERERQRVKSKKCRLLGLASKSKQENVNKWRRENRIKSISHCKVSRAIKKGELEKKPCEICGDPNSQAHHHDYSKPLDVQWLCPKHHGEEHVKINIEKVIKEFMGQEP